MHMKKTIILLIVTLATLSSCSVAKYSSVTQKTSFEKYKYVYITDATSITSSSGGVYGNQHGVFGSQSTKTANPADVIAGNLMKKGFIRIPTINQDIIEETMIVSYGESGRHGNLLGYSTEVTLQFLDAKTMDIIASTTAAGMGETESDDIKKAIIRCFKNLFPK